MEEVTSVILLLKDGRQYLDSLIEAIASQTNDRRIELVVIDSGSTDGGVERLEELCRQHGLQLDLTRIEPHEFGHGSTRNLAIGRVTGDVVAVLSQDALPTSCNWLDSLVAPLEDEKVAGVFGRQVPRPGTRLCETVFYELTYPASARRMDGHSNPEFSNLNLFFSNVNGAFRTDLALAHPFRDDLVMSEDQYWADAVLNEGYSIVYEPEAEVLHSHNYTLRQLFRRYYLSGYSMRQLGLQGTITRSGLHTVLMVLGRVARTRPLSLPYALVYQGVLGCAFVCGRRDLLPGRLRDSLLG